MKRLLFDIEGNGLLPELTKLHCIVAVDIDAPGQPAAVWGPGQIGEALGVLGQADKLIAHFGIGYDFPALEKLYGFKVAVEKQVDTVVISRLKFPNMKELDGRFNKTLLAKGGVPMGKDFGKHTIAAWGRRLGLLKLHEDIEDWSQWTQDMQDRCVGDVATTLKLWDYLKPDQMSQSAIELEHRTARLCRMITAAGWPFDMEKATRLHVALTAEKHIVETELKKQFGSWWQNNGEFTPKVTDKKAMLTRGYVEGQTCTKIERIEFNPQSRTHIELCLRNMGWKPTEFTDCGYAKLDEEMVESVAAEFPQAKGLSRCFMLNKRLGQLADGAKAWFNFVKEDDGMVHVEYNPMGCITSRASHFNFNIAQVPASAKEYGHECRELFYVPKDWGVALGADMSGLEGRCFAHYLAKYDQGAYGEALLKGDPHWAVVLAIGFLDGACERDKDNKLHTIVREAGAKRGFYAMLYGAGDEEVGRIILEACRLLRKTNPEWTYAYQHFFGDNEAPGTKALRSVGGAAKRSVIEGIPGFKELKETISRMSDCGYLPGLDGRRLPIRSDHGALNALLQSAGAILCKRWICDAYDALIASGLKWGWDGDFVFLGWIHDEVQVACRNGLGDRIGEVLTETARASGNPYKFRIALDSEYTIGHSWADTH